MPKLPSMAQAVAVVLAAILLSQPSLAQQLASSSLPDAPEPQQSSATSVDAGHSDPQTKRILGIFPNFRAVSTDTHLPPQSVKEKFVTASQDSFDYSAFVLPILLAGYGQATNETPEFHQG